MTKEIVDFQPGDVFNYQFSNGEVEPFVVIARSFNGRTCYNLASLKDGQVWSTFFILRSDLKNTLRNESFVKSQQIVNFKHSEENPFKQYTDGLAKTLLAKNKDYGDSFTKSLDKFGMVASVVRLEDKFNRLDSLTASREQNVKDESLADTFLDLAGYSILSYKYLKEHEEE
ncbi:nucleotide modification associated domain-containing protein [Lactobacillus sp. PSON]|uniref:nucleotide modification associated domain-containing protein n=1 Tax=Lactobacillus sp. PSON TaxID=3455454 RepID=UPI0040434055